MTKQGTFLDALKQATEDDLAGVDERIAELTKELDSLHAARRVIDVMLHGKKARAKPGTRGTVPKGGTVEGHRMKAAVYLSKYGITPMTKVVMECNIPEGSMTGVFNHEWFIKGNGGVQLSTVGQMAARKAG